MTEINNDPFNTPKQEKLKLSPEELAALCREIADAHKADNIIQLKMSELTVIADYFILCTGNSTPHLRAIADSIPREIRKRTGIHPSKLAGTPESKWMIVDYGSVIVHVLSPEARDLYQLESLWGDAPRLDAMNTIKKASGSKSKKSVTAAKNKSDKPLNKATVKKTAVKKAPVKKSPAKKAPAKKAPVKKSSAKKAPAKKGAFKKTKKA